MTKNPPPTQAETREAVEKFQRVFAERTVKLADRDCIVWKTAAPTNSYGLLNVKGRIWGCHRLAVLADGSEIPPNCVVSHACDNRACVLPAHLIVSMRAYCSGNNNWARHRRSLRMTQKQMGELLGVTATQVSNYEHDRVAPSSEVIIRAINLWGCEWLITGEKK